MLLKFGIVLLIVCFAGVVLWMTGMFGLIYRFCLGIPDITTDIIEGAGKINK